MFHFLFRFTKSLSDWNKSKSDDTVVSPAQMKLIRERVQLDLELFDYANRLFDKRLQTVRSKVSGYPGLITA